MVILINFFCFILYKIDLYERNIFLYECFKKRYNWESGEKKMFLLMIE